MEIIPNQPSDAGPDRPEREATYVDELEGAEDSIADAKRIFRQDKAEEDRLRRIYINDAIEALQTALTMLPAVPK